MTNELKPVKCGCDGDWSLWSSYDQKRKITWYVQCDECGIRTEEYNTEQEAIAAWNKVMGNVQKMHDSLVHCKDCKHYAEDVFAYADHTPIIVAHGACKVWGGPLGSKTDPEGWCYLGVRKEDNDWSGNEAD